MNTDKLASTNIADRRAWSRKAAYALGVVVGIISIYAAFRFAVPPDPTYQGKRLSEWVVDLDDLDALKPRESQQKAKEAIQAIGAEGVPMLISMLRRHDSAFRRNLAKEFGAPSFAQAEVYQKRAFSALEILGPSAREAMPELIAQFQQAELSPWAADAIMRVDPEAAMGVLAEALSHTNKTVREVAADRLGFSNVATNADPIIPALLRALKDSDPQVRIGVAFALGRFRKSPNVVVPALIWQLSDTNIYCRLYALDALAEFGNHARAAAPAIQQCISETNAHYRARAVAALVRVDPDAAAQAGYSPHELVIQLESINENTKTTSMFALWMLQAQLMDYAPQVVPALTARIGDTNQKIRGLAVTTLGEFGTNARSALPALASHLQDPDESFRVKVRRVIEEIDSGYFARTNH